MLKESNPLIELIQSRHSCRAFNRALPVANVLIETILSAARSAPSSQNNQPWRCHVFNGDSAKELSNFLLDAFDSGAMENTSNLNQQPPYKNRSKILDELQSKGLEQYAGWWFQQLHGIPREDANGRRQLYRKNYEFYGAPAHIIIAIPSASQGIEGSFLDAGCFIQNILLAAKALGLGAIPQYSIAAQQNLIDKWLAGDGKREKNADDLGVFVAGISIGYPENEMKSEGPPRHPLSDFVSWY